MSEVIPEDIIDAEGIQWIPVSCAENEKERHLGCSTWEQVEMILEYWMQE